MTIDSGTGAINIGTAIAKTITLGNATGATGLVLNSGTKEKLITWQPVVLPRSKATAVPTTDMLNITNAGQAVASGGQRSAD